VRNTRGTVTLKLFEKVSCRARDIDQGVLRHIKSLSLQQFVICIRLSKYKEASRVHVKGHKVVLDATRVQRNMVHRELEQSIIHVSVVKGHLRLLAEADVCQCDLIYELHFHSLKDVLLLQVEDRSTVAISLLIV